MYEESPVKSLGKEGVEGKKERERRRHSSWASRNPAPIKDVQEIREEVQIIRVRKKVTDITTEPTD